MINQTNKFSRGGRIGSAEKESRPLSVERLRGEICFEYLGININHVAWV